MKGLRTVLVGVGVALLGVLESMNVTKILDIIPDQYDPLVISGVGFLMVILRFVTTTPVGKSG